MPGAVVVTGVPTADNSELLDHDPVAQHGQGRGISRSLSLARCTHLLPSSAKRSVPILAIPDQCVADLHVLICRIQ
jgi:hypothetical protein